MANLGETDVQILLKVQGEEFLLFKRDGLLMLTDGLAKEMIKSRVMASVDVMVATNDVTTAIVQRVAKPHNVLESSKSLLLFYLTVAAVVQMFYEIEFPNVPGELV